MFGAVTLITIVLVPAGPGTVPAIVAPVQSIDASRLGARERSADQAPHPCADTNVTPAGRMSRTATFRAASVPTLETLSR